MVNPTEPKGVETTLALAGACPQHEFVLLESWQLSEEQRASISGRLSTLPNVRLVSFTPDVWAVFDRTAVLLVPSRWHEAFGRVVIEANARGVPCLVSRRGGLPEAVGGGGVVVEPDAPLEVWAHELDRLLDDRRYWRIMSDRVLHNARRTDTQPAVVAKAHTVAIEAMVSDADESGGDAVRIHRPRDLAHRETVSVVIPCYRYGRYLPTAVESVLSQDDVDVEVIVIDDASDDESPEVVRSYGGDTRVHTVLHEVNRGHIATYNEGLAQARGDYVLLLSADDAISPGALGRAVSLMQRHPRVGLVYGHVDEFHTTLPHPDVTARSWSTWGGHEWLRRTASRSRNPVYTPSVVMRREAWEGIALYDGRVPHAADMLLWFQTAVNWDIGRVNNRAQARPIDATARTCI